MNTSKFVAPDVEALERRGAELRSETERFMTLERVMLEPQNDMERQAQIDLEAQILRALAHAKYPKKDLAQIAKWNGIDYVTVEAIAKKLATERGLDLEQVEFNAMVKQVQAIEEIKDEGFREWKLQELARTYRRSQRELMSAYSKALVNQNPIVGMKMSDLRAAQSQDLSTAWSIQGWFPAGFAVLFHAHGGTGKTLFMYEVAAAIAKGTRWNDYPATRGRVLILQCEEPVPLIDQRLSMLGVTDDDPLEVYRDWTAAGTARLESYLKHWQEAGDPVRMVLVDSLTAINSSSQAQEKDTEYARPVRQLSRLAAEYKATVVLIHHENAKGTSRGASDIHDAVSEVWAFSTHNEATGQRLLRVLKNRGGKPPGRYLFDFNPSFNSFTFAGEDGEDHGTATTHQKRVELWLSETTQRGKPYETEEIAEFLAIPLASARRALNELWSKGLINRDLLKRGRFCRYLYWVGDLKAEYTDRDRQTTAIGPRSDRDRPPDRGQDAHEMDILETAIGKSQKNPVFQKKDFFENTRSADRGDRGTSNKGFDHDRAETAIGILGQAIAVIAVNDLVVAKATAIWHKAGSDKLNSRSLRPSQKDKATIPLMELPDEIFHELTAPCRVIEVNKAGDRLKLRNQKTGKTWVCNADGLEVLEARP